MKKYKGEKPYEGYEVTEYMYTDNKRVSVRIQKGKEKIHMLRSRYNASVKEGRILNKKEEVDHIDNDKTNDSIDNLQVISDSLNVIKNRYDESKYITYAAFKCPICGKMFSKEKRHSSYYKKGGYWDTCGDSKCIRRALNLPKQRIGMLERADEFGFDKYYLGDFNDLSEKKELENLLDENQVKYIKK